VQSGELDATESGARAESDARAVAESEVGIDATPGSPAQHDLDGANTTRSGPSSAPSVSRPAPAHLPLPVRIGGSWHTTIVQSVILAAAFGLVFALFLLVQRLAQPLSLLFLGIVIGEALAPVVGWLARAMPRGLALATVYAALASLVALIAWLVVPQLIADFSMLYSAAPGLLANAETQLDQMIPGLGQALANGLQSAGQGLLQHPLTVPLDVGSVAIQIVVVFFFSIYWILTGASLHRFAVSLVPSELKAEAASIFDELGGMLGGYARGVALDAMLIGTIAYIGLRIIGVPFAVVLGLLTAIGDLIPLVGPTVVWLIATAVALIHSPVMAAETLGFYLVLGQFDANVTLPLITHGAARIPPLLMIFALVAGGIAGGILGAIIAIPLFGALRIVFVRVVAPFVRAQWATSTTRP
jgi:predicted PurR-regulated permease PerM